MVGLTYTDFNKSILKQGGLFQSHDGRLNLPSRNIYKSFFQDFAEMIEFVSVSAFVERWCKLRGNLLFYCRTKDKVMLLLYEYTCKHSVIFTLFSLYKYTVLRQYHFLFVLHVIVKHVLFC